MLSLRGVGRYYHNWLAALTILKNIIPYIMEKMFETTNQIYWLQNHFTTYGIHGTKRKEVGRKNQQHLDTKRGQLPPVVLWISELIEYFNLFPTSTSCPTWLNCPHLIFDDLIKIYKSTFFCWSKTVPPKKKNRWTLNDWVIINPQWGMVNLIVTKSPGQNGLWTFWVYFDLSIYIYMCVCINYIDTHI